MNQKSPIRHQQSDYFNVISRIVLVPRISRMSKRFTARSRRCSSEPTTFAITGSILSRKLSNAAQFGYSTKIRMLKFVRIGGFAVQDLVIEDDFLFFLLVVNRFHSTGDLLDILVGQSRFGLDHRQSPNGAFVVRSAASACSFSGCCCGRCRALCEAKTGQNAS